MIASIRSRLIVAAGVVIGGLSACVDFDAEEQEWCLRNPERCGEEGVDAGQGTDAGQGADAGSDAGCTPTTAVDLPDDRFQDTDCDGVDGQADAGLFIDPASGSDTTGRGTREAPLATLGQALRLLREADGGRPVRLYLAAGAYNEAGLMLDVPASLHGGYTGSAGGWQRNDAGLALLNGGTVGLTVRDLRDAGIVLEYVNVRSANGMAPSEPSIALRVLSSSGVELRHAVLEAGLGAPGADGGAGTQGADGPVGGNGDPATGTAPGNAGTAAMRSCAGSNRAGGNGAGGVVRAPGNPGAPGQPDAGGGDGGAATTSADCDPNSGVCQCNGRAGGPGFPGVFGAEGPPGFAGTGVGMLDVAAWTWRPSQDGRDGEVGLPGEGGGGGGSGGTCTSSSVTFVPAASGSGGAGGGGGCGGTGGKGGGAGGASIALLVGNAQVTVSGGTELHTLGGGPGGNGGPGGAGGQGGRGGDGGTGSTVSGQIATSTYVTTGGRGGSGGRGGNGGNGGAGGGGGGGPSVGVWCGGDRAGVVLADGGVTFTLGLGGVGGASPGNSGDTGVQERMIGCAASP